MSLYHVNILTRESNGQIEYQAVEVQDSDGHRYLWESDNPVLDWAFVMQYLREKAVTACFGSSLSDFVMDVPGYRFIEDANGCEWLMYDPRDMNEKQE